MTEISFKILLPLFCRRQSPGCPEVLQRTWLRRQGAGTAQQKTRYTRFWSSWQRIRSPRPTFAGSPWSSASGSPDSRILPSLPRPWVPDQWHSFFIRFWRWRKKVWRLTLTLLSARPSHLSVGFSHHNTETLMWRQPLGNSHLIFRFFLAQVPAEANKQFIGRKIGSFYHRITLPRPINLHLDCQYSIDRPIIASMELRKKSSGSISIFHLSFFLFGSSILGLTYMKYEQTGRIISYPLHFLSSLYPAGIITYLQQIWQIHPRHQHHHLMAKINWLSCILGNMEKSI